MRGVAAARLSIALPRRWLLAELRSTGTRHSAVIFLGRVAQLGLGFAASLLIARTLGPADFGAIALISLVFVAADTLGDFGLTSAAVRAISRSRVTAPDHARRLVHGYVGLAILANLVAAVVGISLAGPIARLVLGRPDLELYLQVALLGLVSSALSGLVLTLLQAFSRFGKLSAIQVLTSISYLGGVLVLAVVGWLDVWSVVILGVLNPLVGFLVGFRLLPYRILAPAATLSRPARSTWGELASFGRWVWVSSLLMVPALRLELLLLGHWASASSVGVYALALTMALRLDVVNRTRHTVLLPAVSALRTPREAAQYLRSTFTRSVLLGAPFLLAVPLAAPLVETSFGSSYADAVPAFQVLLGAVVLDLALTPFLLLAYPLNAPRLLAASDAVRVASLALLGVWLIPGGGPSGAALARLGAVLIGAAFTLVALWRIVATRGFLPSSGSASPLMASQGSEQEL